jgi:hypothetical protein
MFNWGYVCKYRRDVTVFLFILVQYLEFNNVSASLQHSGWNNLIINWNIADNEIL